MAKMKVKMAEMTDEQFKTCVGSVNTDISEKDKNLGEAFARVWSSEMATHKYKFDRQ